VPSSIIRPAGAQAAQRAAIVVSCTEILPSATPPPGPPATGATACGAGLLAASRCSGCGSGRSGLAAAL